MRYTLSPQYSLRGWIGMPYALVHNGSVRPVSREEFYALLFCDGLTDIDSLGSPAISKTLLSLEEKGFVCVSEMPKEIDPHQRYRYFNNRFLKSFYWSITGACNFRCRHCYINAPDALMGELSHEEAISIIDQIAECGVYHLLLSGGEPLLRKDFWSLVDHALEKEIQIDQVYTNGWLLTDEMLDQFEARGLKPEFFISYDGLGWHDWMRGVKGAEQATLDALARCERRGFPTGVEMCIHRGNANVIRESINLLAKTGTRSIKCSGVSPTELWRQNSEGNDMSMEGYFDAVLQYLPRYFEDGMPVNVLFGGVVSLYKGSTDYWCVAEFDEGSDECLKRHICGAVRSSCYIAPDGRLLPCMPIAAGPEQNLFPKVQEIDLQQALKDSFFMEFADRRVSDLLAACKTCRECPHHLCCGGGCRADAVTGGEHNLMGPDPARCLMWKGGYLQRVHEACDRAINALKG